MSTTYKNTNIQQIGQKIEQIVHRTYLRGILTTGPERFYAISLLQRFQEEIRLKGIRLNQVYSFGATPNCFRKHLAK